MALSAGEQMKQYLDLMRHVLEHGDRKTDRTGTGTLSIFGWQMRFNLEDGFPLLTTKKLHVRSIIHELLWFLQGDTNIRYLRENGVSIWDEWADENGELGPVYGKQWRRWETPEGTTVDQIARLVEGLKNNPDSRRHLVSAWNPGEIERMALPLPDKPAIAVLPFANMSDDPKQDYFADGMTDDLITELSKVSGLFVIARNSTFSYKGKTVPPKQVSEELGVRYVLEGSVQRAGDQLRINAQLIDALSGGHAWADRFDGSLADVFALQDKVTNSIADALAIRLTTREQLAVNSQETQVPAAYDAFLKKWATLCPAVAKSLEEAGLELLTYYDLPKAMWKSLRTTNTLENLNREFRRRTKTQASFSTENAALILLYGLVACGQIQLRKIDGHQQLPSFIAKEWQKVA